MPSSSEKDLGGGYSLPYQGSSTGREAWASPPRQPSPKGKEGLTMPWSHHPRSRFEEISQPGVIGSCFKLTSGEVWGGSRLGSTGGASSDLFFLFLEREALDLLGEPTEGLPCSKKASRMRATISRANRHYRDELRPWYLDPLDRILGCATLCIFHPLDVKSSPI